MLEELKLDIETFSPVDLAAAGVFKYCQHPQFQILLFAYKDIITGKVECIDMVKNPVMPGWIIEKLLNPKVRKVAHNAMFEMACISSYLMTMMITDDPLDPAEWSCSAARATSRGFPLSLDAIAQVMHLQTQKDKRGYQLIRYFCMPTKEGKRNYPKDNPDGWKQFIEYCKTDVIVEDEICQKLGKYDLTDDEQRLWILDQKINTVGVRIDKKFVINNIKFNVQFKDELAEEATKISGLSKPNSVAQLKKYIQAENDSDEPITTLDKKAIQKLLKADDINDTVRRLLEIREMSGKSSMKKYHTMLESMCDDGRVKGMFQYCGANRTGRWAGRGVQLHNLPRNNLKELDYARAEFSQGDYEFAKCVFPNIADTSSQLIRTAFIPEANHSFIISDFSAIEARVVAWLANERWRLDVFNSHGKIYEASAAQMFKVPIESVTKGSDLRTRGKIAELALGYGGSEGALQRMDTAGQLPLKEERLELVYAWRAANPGIVGFWEAINLAASSAINGQPMRMSGMSFSMDRGSLKITLPSGRALYYLGARIGEGKFGACIKYHGLDQKTKKWFPQDTYGGKLTENVTQAIARDCLADAMLRSDIQGFKIVMHVHDEIVVEVPESTAEFNLERLDKIMCTPPWWGSGTKSMPVILPLKGDSFISSYYQKS